MDILTVHFYIWNTSHIYLGYGFGEYFQYDLEPDYWLTEVSGIPFGLTGEMLEKGGRPYHGLIYGMTTRVYHIYNPGALWNLFKEFDIKNSEMLGYWVEKKYQLK